MNNLEESETDGFEPLGVFTPSEANRLLSALRNNHLRFAANVETKAGTSNFNAAGVSRSFVGIRIHKADQHRAQDLIKELGLNLVVDLDEVARSSLYKVPATPTVPLSWRSFLIIPAFYFIGLSFYCLLSNSKGAGTSESRMGDLFRAIRSFVPDEMVWVSAVLFFMLGAGLVFIAFKRNYRK